MLRTIRRSIARSRSRGEFARGLLLGASAGGAVIGVMTPGVAAAHDASSYFNHRFTDSTVAFYFDASFPANSPFPLRDRVREGNFNWYAYPSNRPTMSIYDGSVNYGGWNAPCQQPYSVANGLHWFGLDGADNELARTTVCYDSAGHIMTGTSHIAFDSGETWWAYDSAPPSNAYYDLESIATHEFGHALGGWLSDSSGHWKSSSDLCTSGPIHTMCPVNPKGSADWRTPESHDGHTMQAGYA